jgi:hypothetical protein
LFHLFVWDEWQKLSASFDNLTVELAAYRKMGISQLLYDRDRPAMAEVNRYWVETTADQAISGIPQLLPVFAMQPKIVMCQI